MKQKEAKVYQHGTLGMLVPGLFNGTLSVAELLEHGDHGIGTANGLDGEMILLAGTPYLVQSTGRVRILEQSEKVPFATVHFAQKKDTFEGEALDKKAFEQAVLAKYPYKNLFFAVTATGRFKQVKTRAVAKQEPPYPPLTAVAAAQTVFEKQNVTGTLLGYYAPGLFDGMAVAGYHLHFLDDAKSFGGHVLDFELASGKISVEPFATVEQHFPLQDESFLAEQIESASLHAQLKQAEG